MSDDLKRALGAFVAIPVRNEATALELHLRRRVGPFGPACDRCAPDPCDCPPCDECGEPIVSDDPDLCHTPDTRRFHAACCPDCKEDRCDPS